MSAILNATSGMTHVIRPTELPYQLPAAVRVLEARARSAGYAGCARDVISIFEDIAKWSDALSENSTLGLKQELRQRQELAESNGARFLIAVVGLSVVDAGGAMSSGEAMVTITLSKENEAIGEVALAGFIVLGSVVLLLLLPLGWVWMRRLTHKKTVVARLRRTGQPPVLVPLTPGHRWHLFLSHSA